jgi:hypothetical protein
MLAFSRYELNWTFQYTIFDGLAACRLSAISTSIRLVTMDRAVISMVDVSVGRPSVEGIPANSKH